MTEIRNIESLLESHPFFGDIDPDNLRKMAGCACNARFDAGSFVFRENEPADHFYLIREGAVALEINIPGRPPVVIQSLHDGEILGASWLSPPYRWHFDAHVLETTRVLQLDAACLRGKCEADHSLGYELYKQFAPVIIQRMQGTRLQLIDMYANPKSTSA